MESTVPKVALVAPVFNRRETTLQALRSISRIDTSGLEIKVFIVDDGSTDGTAEAISSEFPDVELIIGDGSLHYAAGTNRGIEGALKWGAEWVVTMNDDAVFHELFLQRLLQTARENEGSVVGALLLLWDQPHKVFQVAPKWSNLGGGWNFPDDLTAFSVPHLPFEVECIVGNCVLFPTEAIREVGLLDEKRFPFGWGDAQYLARMKKAGWRLIVDPKALVWCEPNSYPVPLHSLTKHQILNVLFFDKRHPLNLNRQWLARWHSAPSKFAGVASFVFYVFSLARKAIAIKTIARSN